MKWPKGANEGIVVAGGHGLPRTSLSSMGPGGCGMFDLYSQKKTELCLKNR